MSIANPQSTSRKQSDMLPRACTKFKNLSRKNRKPLPPQVFVKLLNSGCSKRQALRFCDRIFCRVDSTQVQDGPSSYRILQRQKNKFDYSQNVNFQQMQLINEKGWTFMPPKYSMGSEYIQSLDQISQVTEHDRIMNKHLKTHEIKMKGEYKTKCIKLSKYYIAMDKKCRFMGLTREKLTDKLQNFPKQLRKDIKEGKFKLDVTLQKGNLIKQLDPFKTRYLTSDLYKMKIQEAKEMLSNRNSGVPFKELGDKFNFKSRTAKKEEQNSASFIKSKFKRTQTIKIDSTPNINNKRMSLKPLALNDSLKEISELEVQNEAPKGFVYDLNDKESLEKAKVINELSQFNKLVNIFNDFYSLDSQLMSKKVEREKNDSIINFLEENPGIHTNVQGFLACKFIMSFYLILIQWNSIKLITCISTPKKSSTQQIWTR